MANKEHLTILEKGVETWNTWREANPDIKPDLSGIKLSRKELSRANFRWANLIDADLKWSNLYHANFSCANLTKANLQGTNLHKAVLDAATLEGTILSYATLTEGSLEGTILVDCHIHRISVWGTEADRATQRNLIIPRQGEPMIAVDDLEVAQFIYMLLKHAKLRKVINSITNKGVLILGRFGGGGLEVLQSIAEKLREMKYLPIIFDFERPDQTDYTETIKILAGLSRFVIVDLSGPSVPQELGATVPHFAIPFVPIIEKGRRPYSMFTDLLMYDWILKPMVKFTSKEHLLKILFSAIISPAEDKLRKRQKLLNQLFNKPRAARRAGVREELRINATKVANKRKPKQ